MSKNIHPRIPKTIRFSLVDLRLSNSKSEPFCNSAAFIKLLSDEPICLMNNVSERLRRAMVLRRA